ncbi:MAG TPA: class I SAM-dependent methyltransferase [Puia sp.]|jgi:predicted O-methyltransferase YrrM
MYSRYRLAQKYLHYYFTAANGKGHGIHSPFVFDLILNVLNDRVAYPDYAAIEGLRRRLRGDGTLLEIEDLGAGSAWKAPRQRSVGDITRRAAKPAKLGQLLFRMARYYRPARVVELGTSLGFSTAYLTAGVRGAGRVWSIEGSGQVAAAAEKNLGLLGLEARMVTGNFDLVLPGVLEEMVGVDLAFVDGNHRRDPTLSYFNQLMEHVSGTAVLIFDDIHWSEEMEDAWGIIKNDPRVYVTVDLFFIGFVFLREEFKVKQDFVIRF